VIDIDSLNPTKYPYKPDVLMGYRGNKVGVLVIPERHVMHDTYAPDGVV